MAPGGMLGAESIKGPSRNPEATMRGTSEWERHCWISGSGMPENISRTPVIPLATSIGKKASGKPKCMCMSQSPGIRNLPRASMICAPGGTLIFFPMARMRPPETTTETSLSGLAEVKSGDARSMTVARWRMRVWARRGMRRKSRAMRTGTGTLHYRIGAGRGFLGNRNVRGPECFMGDHAKRRTRRFRGSGAGSRGRALAFPEIIFPASCDCAIILQRWNGIGKADSVLTRAFPAALCTKCTPHSGERLGRCHTGSGVKDGTVEGRIGHIGKRKGTSRREDTREEGEKGSGEARRGEARRGKEGQEGKSTEGGRGRGCARRGGGSGSETAHGSQVREDTKAGSQEQSSLAEAAEESSEEGGWRGAAIAQAFPRVSHGTQCVRRVAG